MRAVPVISIHDCATSSCGVHLRTGLVLPRLASVGIPADARAFYEALAKEPLQRRVSTLQKRLLRACKPPCAQVRFQVCSPVNFSCLPRRGKHCSPVRC